MIQNHGYGWFCLLEAGINDVFFSVIITPCGIFKDHVNAPSTYTDHVLANIIVIVLRKGFINNGFFKPIRYKLH